MSNIASNHQWIDIGEVTDFPPGYQGAIKLKQHTIALFRLKSGDFYAVDNVCPHQGYPLSKGAVYGQIVTCCWHNFKFDLSNGQCIKGDESVESYDVKVVDQRVWVAPKVPSSSKKDIYIAQLRDALFFRRTGQVARSLVRLLKENISPESLYEEGVIYDAERGEYGTTHASGFAVDLLKLSSKSGSSDPALPLMKLFDFLAETHVRQPKRQTPSPLVSDTSPALAEIVDDIEQENISSAEAKLRRLIDDGYPSTALESCFIQLCCQHFYSFGHGLIYVFKVFELLPHLQTKAQVDLLPALLYSIGTGTREDTLPHWKSFMALMTEVQPQFDAWWTHAVPSRSLQNPSSFRHALVHKEPRQGFDALLVELQAGTDPTYIIDELSSIAARRLIQFDQTIDANPTITNGWLSITHGLTFVNAVRWAYPRLKSPEVLRLLFFSVRFISGSKALCRQNPSISLTLDLSSLGPSPLLVPTGWADSRPHAPTQFTADLGLVMNAILTRQTELALNRCQAFLKTAKDVDSLEAVLYPYLLSDQFVRPIVYAHVIKAAVAAFEETRALLQNQQQSNPFLPILGALRFIASPVREGRIAQELHEAKRLVMEAKVPKSLFI